MLLVEQVQYDGLPLAVGTKSSSSGLLLDADAAGTFRRKPDNNVFITKFLVIV